MIRKRLRPVGWVVGLLLMMAAVFIAVRQADFGPLMTASPWTLLAIAALVMANLIVTAALFQIVTRSFDAEPPVGHGTMFKLICASGLLNYLPLRAGLLGRAAYLKAKHNLPLRQSVAILAVTMVVGTLVLGGTGVAVLLAGAGHRAIACAAALVVMFVLTPLTGPLASRLLRRRLFGAWTWLPLRAVDMLIGGAKLMLACQALDVQITFEHALALRAIGSLIDMVGVTPNGLGLREWAMTAMYPPALAAAVVERAVETVVLIVAGLISLARLPRVEVA
jgi:uncharacterized membrane protein YbhN (UPF0104 family)